MNIPSLPPPGMVCGSGLIFSFIANVYISKMKRVKLNLMSVDLLCAFGNLLYVLHYHPSIVLIGRCSDHRCSYPYICSTHFFYRMCIFGGTIVIVVWYCFQIDVTRVIVNFLYIKSVSSVVNPKIYICVFRVTRPCLNFLFQFRRPWFFIPIFSWNTKNKNIYTKTLL